MQPIYPNWLRKKRIIGIIGLTIATITANSSETNASLERLTLRQAAQLALHHNPSLRAYDFEVRAAEGRRTQAAVRPNPVLSVEIEDVLGTGNYRDSKNAQATLQISHVIELGAKRNERSAVATAHRDLRHRDHEIARIELLASVAAQFIHVLGDQQELDLSREAMQLASETLTLAERRVAAGTGSPIEAKRARIQLTKARLLEEHDEHELLVARRKLASLWGATNATFADLEADLFARPPLPEFTELAARISRSPELKRWATEKSARAAELRLANALRRPDLTASAGVRRYTGPEDMGFVFQFSVPLGISDRQQGSRAEARALVEKSDVEGTALELRLRNALFGIAQELIHAATELVALQNDMIPDAEAALQLAQDGFAQGRFSQLELLDAQRTLLELRRERIVASVTYHQFVIEIEKLLGEPLISTSTQTVTP